MYQNYYNNGYYPQQPRFQPQPQIPNNFGLKGRPVSSFDEVRAAGIDFDGSIFYFPDIANKRIYTKQINIDGTAIFNIYELTQIPTNTAPKEDTTINNNYITRQEFENTINQIQELLLMEESKNANKSNDVNSNDKKRN